MVAAVFPVNLRFLASRSLQARAAVWLALLLLVFRLLPAAVGYFFVAVALFVYIYARWQHAVARDRRRGARLMD